MTTLHHATVKRAAALGVEITEDDGRFTLTLDGRTMTVEGAGEVKANLAEIAEAKANDDLDSLDWDEVGEREDDGDDRPTRSIVPMKYRAKYAPNGDTCGDDIAQELRDYLETENDAGEKCIDRQKLVAFAMANELWNEKYTRLNNGQTRMNVGNRLRAKIRKQPQWQPVWPAA